MLAFYKKHAVKVMAILTVLTVLLVMGSIVKINLVESTVIELDNMSNYELTHLDKDLKLMNFKVRTDVGFIIY